MKSTKEKASNKTLVIVGPTAGGKSDLAILLARKYNGEIISADSRQVYHGMDIGTGKVTKHEQRLAKHWLLDIANPKRNYNVTHFVRDAKKAIADIKKRGKLPIVCGGTGFWIQTLIEDNVFPAVKPDMKLRKKLGKLPTEKLFAILKKKDPARAKTIDAQNKVRLIRAIEIVKTLGKVPKTVNNRQLTVNEKNYIIIALNPNKETLRKNIEVRLEKRLKKGMLTEVKRLHADGISWKRLERFGLEYRWCAEYLQKKVSRQDLEALLPNDIWHYAKRQLTWLRRFEKMGASIHWITDPKEAFKIIGRQD